jgi:hypothetical protein
VLQISIIELETASGPFASGPFASGPFANGEAYANRYLRFAVNLADYAGKVLAVPRCCQRRKGTQDRARVNGSVAMMDTRSKGADARS